MPVSDFRRAGFVQEVNRRLLHPLGLALYVAVDPAGAESLGGILDHRSDPAGVYYGWDPSSPAAARLARHAAAFDAEWERRRSERELSLGWMVQPAGPAPSGAP